MSATDTPTDVLSSEPEWGSDLFAVALRATGVKYVALNPGSSYRGLHDSLVNYLGDSEPQMILCLHEEHAVAIAHGYAKVANQPMGVILHANVGLMHAAMALFNAYCDRVPMVALGATGPLASDQRRPWIDWLHTSQDQGALIRNYVKWDDQASSIPAGVESILRANQVTRSRPCAPSYVCLDVQAQETAVTDEARERCERLLSYPTDPARDPEPSGEVIERVAELLRNAQRPVIMAGRSEADQAAFDRRVALAERLSAAVVTDGRLRTAFPSRHPLHVDAPRPGLGAKQAQALREADVVLALDWVDLGGALQKATRSDGTLPTVVSCSLDAHLHNGWSKDHQMFAPVDVPVACAPDAAVSGLLNWIDTPSGSTTETTMEAVGGPPPTIDVAQVVGADGRIAMAYVAAELRACLGERATCLIRAPFNWNHEWWTHTSPLDFLGNDGGGGVGSGPGLAVGAALALRGTDRTPVAILGDGDYLMGQGALWAAAKYEIPVLIVLANNSSYENDELHQVAMAKERDRPIENSVVGIRTEGPTPDCAKAAEAVGVAGFGPIVEPSDLQDALSKAVELVDSGKPAVVDVHVERRVN